MNIKDQANAMFMTIYSMLYCPNITWIEPEEEYEDYCI